MKKKIPISFSFYKCNLKLFISFILYLICTLAIFMIIHIIIFNETGDEITEIYPIEGNITGIITGKYNDVNEIEIKSNENLPHFNFNEKKEFNIKGNLAGNGDFNGDDFFDNNTALNNALLNSIIFNNNSISKIFGLITFTNNNKGFFGKIKKEYSENYNNTDEVIKFKGNKYDLNYSETYHYSFVINRIIYNIIINFGQILTIFFKFCQFTSKKAINNEDISVDNNDDDSSIISNSNYKFIYNDNSELFKLSKKDIIFLVILLICSIPVPFAEYYLTSYTQVPYYESVYILVMIVIVIIFIHKEKLYKHQKLAVFVAILLGIPEIIINTNFWNKNYDIKKQDEEGENTIPDSVSGEWIEDNDPIIYEYYTYFKPEKIFDCLIFANNETYKSNNIEQALAPDEYSLSQAGANILFILIKIYLAAYLVFSLLFKRRLMEHYYFSPLKVCYLFGFFNLFIYLLVLIINSVKTPNTFHLTHNGYYIDTFSILLDCFGEFPFQMILLIISGTINNLIIVYVIKFFKLFESILLFTLNDLLIMLLYEWKPEEIFKHYVFYVIFIPKYICFLVYLEVIRLKFLNLDKDAKETIVERALLEMETIKLSIEEDFNEDNEEEDDVDANISEIHYSQYYNKNKKKKKTNEDK